MLSQKHNGSATFYCPHWLDVGRRLNGLSQSESDADDVGMYIISYWRGSAATGWLAAIEMPASSMLADIHTSTLKGRQNP